MVEPSEEEWRKLHRDYLYWVVDIDDPGDPPDYQAAADVLLSFLQQHCTHPLRFYGYQLNNLSHLIGELHAKAGGGLFPFDPFRQYCLLLLQLCNEGRLPDTRLKDN